MSVDTLQVKEDIYKKQISRLKSELRYYKRKLKDTQASRDIYKSRCKAVCPSSARDISLFEGNKAKYHRYSKEKPFFLDYQTPQIVKKIKNILKKFGV